MIKEDWKKVEEALSGLFGSVEMAVDGSTIMFQRKLVGKNTLGICVFVNGWIKGIWFGKKNDHPEQAYLNPKESYAYPAKFRKSMLKIRKSHRKELCPDLDEKRVWYSPHFTSVSGIRRHYEKTFKSITLVSINGKPQQ